MQILYRVDGDAADSGHSQNTDTVPRYESVTVSHFLRSYTINHLEPHTRYKLCIAVKDDDQNQVRMHMTPTLDNVNLSH